MKSKKKDSISILETWRDTLISYFYINHHEVINEDFEIIKKNLDRLEKLEKFASIVKEFITIEKLNGYDGDFITQNYSSSRRISKEKADLVKEVLEENGE